MNPVPHNLLSKTGVRYFSSLISARRYLTGPLNHINVIAVTNTFKPCGGSCIGLKTYKGSL